MKNWLVVASAARARVLEMSDEGGVYVHVADLVHPESRQKAGELGADRAGHVTSGKHGTGSAEYRPRTDVHEREQEHFAREVAHVLNSGLATGRCAGLVLVASNPFLGELKAHLDTQARQRVLRTVPSDFTALNDRQLAQRLAAA
jgi:protein required for attachment to host cells